jgi:FkbM family methyltransferase
LKTADQTKSTASFGFLKRIVASVLCHRNAGKIIAVLCRDRIPSHGCRFLTKCDAVRPADKASLFWGIYESAEYRFVRDHLLSGFDTIELGSGIGVISAHIARKLNSDCKLVCVEASPALQELLCQNVRNNAPLRDASFVQAAIYYEKHSHESVSLQINGSHLSSSVDVRRDPMKLLLVPCITLKSIIKAFGIGRYQLVMDIEGAEVGLIQRDREALSNCILLIADREALSNCILLIAELHDVEYGGKSYSVEAVRRILTEGCGFILRARYGPVCVFHRQQFYEINKCK